jgi:hypothetical protein
MADAGEKAIGFLILLVIGLVIAAIVLYLLFWASIGIAIVGLVYGAFASFVNFVRAFGKHVLHRERPTVP